MRKFTFAVFLCAFRPDVPASSDLWQRNDGSWHSRHVQVHGECVVFNFYCCRPRSMSFLLFVGYIRQFSWPDSANLKNWQVHLNSCLSFSCDDVCGAQQFIYVNNLIIYILQLSVLEKVNLINKIKKVECTRTMENSGNIGGATE